MENRKRKREHEHFAPRIKYHVEQLGRSFERILKEESRGELLNVVRKKLKLDDKTQLELVQLRDERLFDLEDDDDFDAFKAAASEYSSLDVRVSFSPGLASSSQTREPWKDQQKDRRNGQASATQQASRDETMGSPSYDDRSQEASPGNLPDRSRKAQKRNVAVLESSAFSDDIPSKGKDAMPSPENRRDEKELPKKKGEANRDAETTSIQQVEATPLGEKTKVKRAKKKSVKGSKLKEMAGGPEVFIPNTFISGESVSAASTSSPTHDTRLLSPTSLIKSTLQRISQNPSTPEEITAIYETTHQQEMGAKKTTSKKSKSRVPGESVDPIRPLSSLRSLFVPSHTSQEANRASQSAAPASSTAVSSPVAAATSVPIPITASTSPSRTLASSKSPRKPVSACPICLGQPFHAQDLCPIIQRGSTVIQKRIEELEQQGDRDDLVESLRGWLTKSSKKAADQPKTKGVDFEHRATANKNLRQKEVLPPHAPLAVEREAQIGKVSHVLVDSRSEGSESTESSTSQSGSGSQSESESFSGPSFGENTGPRAGKPNMDLENVDLEVLMRGPSPKSLMDLIDDEEKSDDSETSISLLEEEEEERSGLRGRKMRRAKRSSPSQSALADDQDSETEPDDEGPYAIDTVSPIGADETNAIEGARDNAGGVLKGQSEDAKLSPVDELHRATPASLVNTEVESTVSRVDATISELPKTPPVELHELRPIASSTPLSNQPLTHPPPGPLTQQMKDGSDLPMNTPDDEIDLVAPAPPPHADETSTSSQATKVPKRRRGRPRGSSLARPAASHPASRARSSSVGAASASASASNKPPPSSSDAAPKRRGRPPLSEALKAERKAIREAEKEARAAQKRVAAAEKKGMAKPSRAGKDTVGNFGPGTNAAAAAAAGSPPPPSPSPGPNPTLTLPSSSPAADRLTSSNAADGGSGIRGVVALPMNADGIKSPGDVSIATSVSRKHDEHDVEEIVVGASQKPADEEFDAAPPRQQPTTTATATTARRKSPLFLPGASQLTQTQTIGHFSRARWDTPASDAERSDDDEEEKTLAAPGSAPIPSSQSTFPVLSQLSFDRFRSNFSLPKRSGKPESNTTKKKNKKKTKEQEVPEEEDSESDDDDESSSSDEARQQQRQPSHIPKGRVAGAGMIKKRKSRGLFNAL